jgi:hypothetical protein
MPRIQEYRRQVNAPGAVDFQRSQPVSALGQGLQELGKSVDNIQNEYQKYQKQEAEHNASQKTANYLLESDKEVDDTIRAYNPNTYKAPEGKPEGWGISDDINEKLALKKQSLVSGTENSYESRALDDRLTTANSHMVMGARTKQTGVEAKYFRTNYVDTSTKLINAVRVNPDSLNQNLKMFQDFNDTVPDTMEGIRGELGPKIVQALHDSALDGRVSALTSKSNPTTGQIQGLMNEMKNEKGIWKSNTSSEKFDQSYSKLENLNKVATARSQDDFLAGIQEENARIARVGIDSTKYKDPYPEDKINNSGLTPKAKASLIEQRQTAIEKGKAKFETEKMTFQKAATFYTQADYRRDSDNNPKDDNKYLAKFDAVQDVLRQGKTEFDKNQIGYTTGIKPEANDLVEYMNVKWEAGKATPEDVDGYVANIKMYQSQVDELAQPRIVPKEMSDKLKSVLSSSFLSAQGGDMAYMSVEKEYNKWGEKHWNDALADYQADGVFNNVSLVGAGIMSDLSKHEWAKIAFLAGDASSKNTNKEYDGVSTDKDLINDAKSSLSKFYASMGNDIGTDKVTSTYNTGLSTIYKYLDNQNKTTSMKDLANIYVNDHYDYKDIGSRTVRIPKNISISYQDSVTGKITKKPYVFDHTILDKTIPGLKQEMLKNPSNYNAPPPINGFIKPEDNQKDYALRVYENGGWANDGDDGVMFVDDTGHPVHINETYTLRDKSGKIIKQVPIPKPIKFTWKELESLPKTRPRYNEVF